MRHHANIDGTRWADLPDRPVSAATSILPPPDPAFAHARKQRQLSTSELVKQRVAPAVQQDLAAADTDLHAKLDFLAQRALLFTHAAGIAIALAENGRIVCRARAGRMAPPLGAQLDPKAGISGECFSTGNILCCADTEEDPRVDLAACRALGIRSLLAVPLCGSHQTLGLIEIFATEPGALGDSQLRMLRLIAGLIIQALSSEGPREQHGAITPDSPAAGAPTPTDNAQPGDRNLITLPSPLAIAAAGHAAISAAQKQVSSAARSRLKLLLLVPAFLVLSSWSWDRPVKSSPSRAAVDRPSSQRMVASAGARAAGTRVSIPDAATSGAVELLDLEPYLTSQFVPHRLQIVIDPGHGGKQNGAIGPSGLKEKDLVLDVALRLGERLRSRLGADIVYTRTNDADVPLESRRLLANLLHADLFISVHANSNPDPWMRGVETYYPDAASSQHERDVASQENAASDGGFQVTVDGGSAGDSNLEQSRALASLVQEALYQDLSGTFRSLPNRGVKRAPFVVLLGAEMPSVLAEISFVSNPEDERKLATSDVRTQVAEALYRGISQYVDSTQKRSEYQLSASLQRKPDGQ